MNQLRHILQHRYLFKLLAIVILLLTIIYTKAIKKESIYTNETSFSGIVYKIKKNDNKTTIYLKSKEKLIVNVSNALSKDINIGDTILVEGTLSKPQNNTIPNQFNYKEYLYYNDIFYIVKSNNIKKIANNTNVIYYFRNIISNRIDTFKKTSEYLKIFILGDNSMIDNNIIDSYRENGISHLFSISGMQSALYIYVAHSK